MSEETNEIPQKGVDDELRSPPAPAARDPRPAGASVDASIDREITRRSRRAFLVGGIAMLAGYGGWRMLRGAPADLGIPSPLRRVLGLNETVARGYFSGSHLARTYPLADARMPRVNGMIGLGGTLDPAAWRLQVTGTASRNDSPTLLTMEAIAALPRVEMVTELRCIEGWSQIVRWGGVRLADFIERYPPATVNGTVPDVRRRPDELLPYVSIETPDRGYYVGLDMPGALHPQTLLCFEMDGKPLTPEHGAPLRLVIPVKYGVKNIKRIGAIRYTAGRPGDYWGERGYDWYGGL